ncbi:MAG: hypothetical protein ABL893_06650, partial [Hyphomicrobium sp.]
GHEIGLTRCYNRLKDSTDTDPEVVALRLLHIDLDQAVLDAYGWSDIAVPPYTTPDTEAGRKALEYFEDEVVDRLFVLNAGRASIEALHGAVPGKKPKAASPPRHPTSTSTRSPSPQTPRSRNEPATG